MPQFDQLTFLNQLFWLFLFFFSFYFIINYFFLPKLVSILKFRKKILQNKLNINVKQNLQNNLNQTFFNNIYFRSYNIITSLKTKYSSILVENIKNIHLYKNKQYNLNCFKILTLKKILGN
jgi:hypothetical protein